jgi:hypothetical protein
MKHGKLRIVWSLAWGVVAVLLVALWVRSYSYQASARCWLSNSRLVSGWTLHGWIELHYESFTESVDTSLRATSGISFQNVDQTKADMMYPVPEWRMGNDSEPAMVYQYLNVPFWLPLFTVGIITAIPWLPLKRFGLRTLLIATTLVVVGLGIVVWLIR